MDQPKPQPPRPSPRGSQGEVIDLPMTPEVFNAKLNKLVSLTAILHQDGETLWDKVVSLQDAAKVTHAGLAANTKSIEKMEGVLTEVLENQKILIKSHQTLTDHVLAIKMFPVSKLRSAALILAGSTLGGAIVAAVLHALN